MMSESDFLAGLTRRGMLQQLMNNMSETMGDRIGGLSMDPG